MKIEEFKSFKPVEGLTYLDAETIYSKLTKEQEKLFEGLFDRILKPSIKPFTKEEREAFESLTPEELTVLCFYCAEVTRSKEKPKPKPYYLTN